MIYTIGNEVDLGSTPENLKDQQTDAVAEQKTASELKALKISSILLNRSIKSKGKRVVLNKEMIEEAKDCMRYHYRGANAAVDSFDPGLVIVWNTFKDAVEDAFDLLGTQIDENRRALKMIHRYDVNTNKWFLTVQCCEIDGDRLENDDHDREYELFNLISYNAYFNISVGGTIELLTIDPAVVGLGGTDIYSRFGPEYFANVNYGANKVKQGRNIQSATFAWEELKKLRTDNNTMDRNDPALFKLVLVSASSEAQLPSEDTYTQYPHSIMLHMRYNVTDCLEDGKTILGNFLNRAADYNSLCPRRCQHYLCPIVLLPVVL